MSTLSLGTVGAPVGTYHVKVDGTDRALCGSELDHEDEIKHSAQAHNFRYHGCKPCKRNLHSKDEDVYNLLFLVGGGHCGDGWSIPVVEIGVKP